MESGGGEEGGEKEKDKESSIPREHEQESSYIRREQNLHFTECDNPTGKTSGFITRLLCSTDPADVPLVQVQVHMDQLQHVETAPGRGQQVLGQQLARAQPN
jgi:hypothetical protein